MWSKRFRGKQMTGEFTTVWFRMLVVALCFFGLVAYSFFAFLIYGFAGDAPPDVLRGYHFIALLVPGYFASFFLIEFIADYHPKVRVLGLAILALVITSLIVIEGSVRIWEGLGKPLLVILGILGSYSLHTSCEAFREGQQGGGVKDKPVQDQ